MCEHKFMCGNKEFPNPFLVVPNLKECVFVNSALKIRCHIVKNTLLQLKFIAIITTFIVFKI